MNCVGIENYEIEKRHVPAFYYVKETMHSAIQNYIFMKTHSFKVYIFFRQTRFPSTEESLVTRKHQIPYEVKDH